MSIVEQRYQAVLAVLGGDPVVDVAQKVGVSRQSVHPWLRRYAEEGLPGLQDRSHRPDFCAHQALPEVEALVCELSRHHPKWGSRRIVFELGRQGCPAPVPSGRPSGRPAAVAAAAEPSEAVEADRTVNRAGTVSLGQHLVLAAEILGGRRVGIRIAPATLTFFDLDTGQLLRTRPNPLTPADIARLRGVRPAGPPPQPATGPIMAQRRASNTGGCHGRRPSQP